MSQFFSNSVFFCCVYSFVWTSVVAQTIRNPPAMWETWLASLGQEDPLEEGMEAHPVFLPGESPWTEDLAGYNPWGCKEWDMLGTSVHGDSPGKNTHTPLFTIAGRGHLF